MMTFAVHKRSYSRKLFDAAGECVLAVPGPSLANETLFCGTQSGRTVDKVAACKFKLFQSSMISVPGIHQAIANIQLKIVARVPCGDHLLLSGEVVEFGVDTNSIEPNLLSVGPDQRGFDLLAKHGRHRIAIPSKDGGASNPLFDSRIDYQSFLVGNPKKP